MICFSLRGSLVPRNGRESILRDWQGYLDSVAHEHAPINRFGSPEELASFFVFLCSKRATYSVGSTYFVDGGMLKVV